MPGKRDGGMPPIGESVKSGNRMSALEAEELKAMKAKKPRGGMPPIGESVKSGNRISAQEAAEMKAMKMKKGGAIKMRKYAEGGLVVSRGADDTSRFRLGLVDDEPMTTGIGSARARMAAAEMSGDEDVTARPTMEELQAANLAAARRREAAQTAPKPRARAAAADTDAPPRLTAADRRTMRDVISAPMDAPKPRKNAQADDARTKLARQIMRDRETSFTARPVSMTEALEIADRQMARGTAPARRVERNSPRTTVAELRQRAANAARARAAEDARRRSEFDDMASGASRVAPVGVRMMKDGGPVKAGSCKRGSDNMAMMAKALKGKK
jgi:hypothetical protein